MRAYPSADREEVERVAAALAARLASAQHLCFAFGHGSFFQGLPHHDVDVAFRLEAGAEPDLFALDALATRCEAAVGRPVDLRALGTPDAPFTAAATAGRLLFARDPDLALGFAELAQRMAWDFRPLREGAIRDLLRPSGAPQPRSRPEAGE